MKSVSGFYTFIRATALGGAIFLIPLVILVIILSKALTLMNRLARTIAGIFNFHSIDSVLVLDIASALCLILVCLLAGLLAETRMAQRFRATIEDRFLDKIPIYQFISSLTVGSRPMEDGKVLIPVWARFDDNSQLAFEVERQSDGRVVVFLPGAPNPWSGSVGIFDAERITPAGMTMLEAISNLSHLGRSKAARPIRREAG